MDQRDALISSSPILIVMALLLVGLAIGILAPWWGWSRRYAWLNAWADAREEARRRTEADRQKWLERRKAVEPTNGGSVNAD